MKITSNDRDNGSAIDDEVNLETITMPLTLMKLNFLKALAMLAEDPQLKYLKKMWIYYVKNSINS